MHRKIHLRKKVKICFKGFNHKFILVIILFVLALFLAFRYINKSVSPLIGEYAKIEAKNISTYIIKPLINMRILEYTNKNNINARNQKYKTVKK